MSTGLGSLPAFLQYLGTFPDAGAAVASLVDGPLATFGARTAILWRLDDSQDALSAMGSFGHSQEELDRYSVIPLALDLPIVHCVRDRSIIVESTARLTGTYLDGIDSTLLDGMAKRSTTVVVVSIPILHAGRTVGALGFGGTQSWESDDRVSSVLDVISAILGLWMTHPLGPHPQDVTAAVRTWSLSFSARRKRILALVAEGLTNQRIADELGMSASSVKADLQQAMQALRTHDRHKAAARARTLGLL